MLRQLHSLAIFILALLLLIGCGQGDPVSVEPGTGESTASSSASSSPACERMTWGIWDFICDPATGSLETIPLRSAGFNVNVVRFLQPPISPVNMLTVSIQSGTDIPNGLWVVDVNIRHPFFSMPIYRGFDVRGIVMAEGSVVGMHDSGVLYHAPDGTRLLNPDGYTRWWNQTEFTSYGKIFGYTEGSRAIPGFTSTATLNPYKLFADDLGEKDPVFALDPDRRATFGTVPGINSRRYVIQFDIDGGSPPVRFKYAVDASWALPDKLYEPIYPLEAYSPSANCREVYLLSTAEFEEIPYYVDPSTNGGSAVFGLTIGDWQATPTTTVLDELSHIWVESPTMLSAPIDVLPSAQIIGSDHPTQATVRITVPGCHPTGPDDQYFLITAESAHPDSYMPQIQGDPYAFDWPDAALAAYSIVDVPISDQAPQLESGLVVGLPDWCSLTEFCTNGSDNLQFVTNLVNWDLDGFYNDEIRVKWWEGHVIPTPPYSTGIIQNHITSLGYTFERTSEPEFLPEGCRMIIVVQVKAPGGGYTPFTPVEADRMRDYVKNGGILCFLIENPTYFDPGELELLLDMLQVPLGYGGFAEPPSDTTLTTEITPHELTTNVENWQYWTCGEWILESDECISLVRSPTEEHIVVLAPIPLD